MTEYYCEQVNATIAKCSEIIQESNSPSDGFIFGVIVVCVAFMLVSFFMTLVNDGW